MKKLVQKLLTIVAIILMIVIGIYVYDIISNPLLSKEEAKKIGEERYLAFLWMVDGAFNYERYNQIFQVNGKSEVNSTFICEYQDNSQCIGKNFVSSFDDVFSNSIHYDKVYGDGISFNWYEEKDNVFTFNNSINCYTKRMGTNHTLEPLIIRRDKITYRVTFQDEDNERIFEKNFILKHENHEWKVISAYYHDPCYMDYNIE